jgi:hypothetical protein
LLRERSTAFPLRALFGFSFILIVLFQRLQMTRFGIRAAVAYVLGTAAILVSVASSVRPQQRSPDGVQAEAPAQVSPEGAQGTSRPAGATLANFAWLDGRWQGNWGPRVAEQTWMAPKAGVMVGVFREIGNDKTLVIELFSLVETPDGIEYRSRHFTPSLAPWEGSGPTVLKLAGADPARIDFENATDGNPKRVVFTRTGPDTYVSRSEIVSNQGDTQVTEITYRRQPPSGGSAGRR